jgi:hypothetical protein
VCTFASMFKDFVAYLIYDWSVENDAVFVFAHLSKQRVRPSPSIKDMNTRPMSVWSSLSKLICISIVVDCWWLVV